jgi:hypothetical protein
MLFGDLNALQNFTLKQIDEDKFYRSSQRSRLEILGHGYERALHDFCRQIPQRLSSLSHYSAG